MIDVHAHLCFPDFDRDREKVVRECGKSMEAVIVGSARHDEGLCSLRLCQSHDFLFPTLGYHPTEGGDGPSGIMELIRENRRSVVGVGEVGLDHHWEKDAAKRRKQADVFSGFIGLAEELKKPLVVHSWDAERECFGMVKRCGVPVVFHCYSGSAELASEILDSGFFISFSTQVLFSKAHRKLAKAVPLKMMTLETDSPFLSPFKRMEAVPGVMEPKPGFDPGRNCPWNVAFSAAKIAGLKGAEASEVMGETSRNARRIFGLPG